MPVKPENRHHNPPGTATECRSCAALIVWTRTKHGKKMPCDVSPSTDGQFYLFRRPDCIEAIHIDSRHPSAEKARARAQNRHQSHFVTCPDAARHRKRS